MDISGKALLRFILAAVVASLLLVPSLALADDSPPSLTSAPTLSTDNPQQGVPVTVTDGTWDGSPAPTFTYQWLSCDNTGNNCNDIPGAISNSYSPTPADVGNILQAQVTATNSSASDTENSEASNVVISAGCVNTPVAPGGANPSGPAVSCTTITSNINGGVLSLSAPAAVSAAPDIVLNGLDQSNSYQLALQTKDNTGTGDGWKEDIAQTPFTDGLGHNLGNCSVTNVDTVAANNSGSTPPTDTTPLVSLPVPVSTTPAVFKVADNYTGLGAFIVTPTVTVQVPANTHVGSYTAVATVDLTSGP